MSNQLQNWTIQVSIARSYGVYIYIYTHTCALHGTAMDSSYLLVWIISMPASDSRMLVAVQKIVAFSKLQ